MGRSHRLGAAVGLASIVAATGAAPASADVPVTVTPVHGRTFTTFAIKFTPPVRNERYRNLIILTGPVGSRCRRPYGDTLYTPGETPPPANQRLTWRFGPHARPDVAANGDFSFRPTSTRGWPSRPLLPRWCRGLWRGRLDVEHWEPFLNDFGTPSVFARFSFRVR